MKVRILGCGTSYGVPRVGNDWGECDPAEPRNRRRRVSILVEHEEDRILVDTSPDLREQLLDANVADMSAVLWTHDHADHCHGIDDLRQIFHSKRRPLPGFARADTMSILKTRFTYAFEGRDGYPPIVELHPLPDTLQIGEIRVRTVDQPHGTITSAGFRMEAAGNSIGYSTDFNVLTNEMENLFRAVDIWIVDTLRRRPHPTHPHLDQVLKWVDRLGPGRTILTHMDNSMDYRSLAAELPVRVEPGYDGMEIEL